MSFLKPLLTQLASPVVFCHNDLLLKNIIYHEEAAVGPAVTFIDFEYAGYNFQAFDIANHFCEFAGVDTYDATRFPDAAFQRRWLAEYLAAWKALTRCRQTHLSGGKRCGAEGDDDGDEGASRASDDELRCLQLQVRSFVSAAHLLWGVWALLQSQHSNLDFDFLAYARARLTQYFADRDQQSADQERHSADLPSHNGH